MRIQLALLFSTALLSACNQTEKMSKQSFQWPTGIKPPVADKKPFDVGLYGDKRTDDYYWMNDYFKKGPDSNKVVDFLKAENAYLDSMMAGIKPFQQKLFDEMKARIKEKDETVPVFNNDISIITGTKRANNIMPIAAGRVPRMRLKKYCWTSIKWRRGTIIFRLLDLM